MYGTAKNASIRNRGDAYFELMRHIFGAPCKVLSINDIAIFRVIKIATLKMA